MMKKVLIAVAAAAVLSSSAHAALTLDWAYSANLSNAGKGTFTIGWLVQMYEDVSKDSVLNNLISVAKPGGAMSGATLTDDVLINSFTQSLAGGGKAGVVYAAYALGGDALLGKSVYTVIFNASTLDDATQAIVVDSNPLAIASDANVVNYTQSSVAGNWVGVVPEPGTLALLGIGAAVLGLRRRVRR